jgi:hypothetical protein
MYPLDPVIHKGTCLPFPVFCEKNLIRAFNITPLPQLLVHIGIYGLWVMGNGWLNDLPTSVEKKAADVERPLNIR